MGRDDPARSSVDFSGCGIEYEEEDLASDGRDWGLMIDDFGFWNGRDDPARSSVIFSQ